MPALPGPLLRRRDTSRQLSGDAAEQQALRHLEGQGLSLRERNFRCKAGEIDLIMADRATLVFIEVRKRGSMAFGGAAASVTRNKQMRLIRAAHWYLTRYSVTPPCRFDVVAVDGGQLSWLKDAFSAD